MTAWSPGNGRRLSQALALGAVALASLHAGAQTWRIQPSVEGELQFTNNVDLSPSATRRSDFVTVITPSLDFTEKGAHSEVVGTITLPILLYARTGGENNTITPEANVTGTFELYPRLFYVDGSVQVSQEYLSPFGPRPQNLVSVTDNRYTAQSYRVSPYIKGEARGGLNYELRNNNIWTDSSDAADATDALLTTSGRAYTNEIIGSLARTPQPLGWGLDYNRIDTQFSGQRQNAQLTEIARARALWRPDPQLELSAIAGYEDNQYLLAHFSGAVYGAGARWRPTDRTNVEARWEHRFFGGSYYATFDHRTALTVWNFQASRDITSYPQELARLSSGRNVSTLLNELFISRVADPVQRQTLVDQFIRDRGLPSTLSEPLSLVSQQVTLQESLQATMGLLGARNSVFMSLFRVRNEPIESGSSVVDELLSRQLNNTQTGANVVWTYRITPLYTLATSAEWNRTVAHDVSDERSTQQTLQSIVSAPLSPLTTFFAGARYQRLTSNIQETIPETAVFVGVSHIFR